MAITSNRTILGPARSLVGRAVLCLALSFSFLPSAVAASYPHLLATKAVGIMLGNRGPIWTEFFDPDCPFCHILFQELYPLVKKGEIRLRMVPVAVIDAQSLPRDISLLDHGPVAARLLSAEKGFTDGHMPLPLANPQNHPKLADAVVRDTGILEIIDPSKLIPCLVFTNTQQTVTAKLEGVPNHAVLLRALRFSGAMQKP